ncbi:MAG: tetratricopeptide repeat protein [Cyanobacteria bacterium]|nr:tetratricopeptide repeat protein [Cyanobacteriota bacterium]
MTGKRTRRNFCSALSLAVITLAGPSVIGSDLDARTPSPAVVWAKFGRTGKHTVTPSEEFLERGKACMRREELDGAIDAFLQATYFARNGYFPEAFYWLGVCYKDKQENDKAIKAFVKAREQYVEPNWDINIALAEIYIHMKKFDECDLELRQVNDWSNKKRMYRVFFTYGLMYNEKGDFGNAESNFERALGDHPWTWTKAWLYLAEAKMKQKRWKDAMKEFDDLLHAYKFLKAQPDARIHLDIGVCKLAIGDHQGAVDHWNRSLDYNRHNPEVWLQLAMLYETEGHLSSAAKDYQEFIKQMPPNSKDPRIQQARDRLTRIEQKLTPNETAPTAAKPSIYMRNQMDGLKKTAEEEQRQVENERQETQRQETDSGF